MATRLPRGLHAPVDDEVTTLVVDAINRANQWTLGGWMPTNYPNGVAITPLSEHGVRHPAAAALALAAALTCGVHDPDVTGATDEQARAAALELVTAVAGSHRTNMVGGWGPAWQSALWAYLAGAAGWLLWDDLSEGLRQQVSVMVADEADRIASLAPPMWTLANGTVVTPGDSKAEENAWNASAIALAVALWPTDSRVITWTTALARWSMSAHLSPADTVAPVTVNGVSTSSLGGWNTHTDGTLVNHGMVQPDYMVAAAASIWGAAPLFGAADALWPTAGFYGADRSYGALHRAQWGTNGAIYQPDGSIFYPAGADWGAYMYADKAAADVIAWRYGWGGPNAHTAAVQHLQRVADMQARSTTGQSYVAVEESTYPGREQWVGHHMAHALLALCADVTESNLPAAQLAVANGARGVLDGEPMTTTTPLTGEATFTPVAGQLLTKYTTTVTFPPGSFSSPPRVLVSPVSASEDAQLCGSAAAVTATGFKAVLSHAAGFSFATTGRRMHWVAYPAEGGAS